MAGGSEDDEDDTHYCIKCGRTLRGLQVYVSHRKAKCRGQLEVQREAITAERDFFSSLNLQSSGGSCSLRQPVDWGPPSPAYTGGKWRPGQRQEEEEIQIEVAKENPPPGYTGGKWKPSQIENPEIPTEEHHENPPPGFTGGKWKPTQTENLETQREAVGSENPPPGHTGGKWRPTPNQETPGNSEVMRRSDSVVRRVAEEGAPPPGHTRGKWAPGQLDSRPWGQLRQGLYWCGPCGRRLSSRVVYERHIRSELHFKRTNQSPRDEPQIGTRKRVRTKAILSSSLKVINRRYAKEKEPPKRKKKGGPMVCQGCRCKVWPHLIGKHLVSHYHSRHRRPGWEELVFKHMSSIVKHFPFQCGLCKFYTNTRQDFNDHWMSQMHRENDAKLVGRYWCNVCKIGSDTAADMTRHLSSDSHLNVISVINRSVPVIVQKHLVLRCDVCSIGFRYNFQLRKHALLWNHPQTKSTASDLYQEVTNCQECNFISSSLSSYQRHLRMKHETEMHFCRKCNLRFATLEEAKKHRQDAKHRETGDFEVKNCIHCHAEFVGLAALRDHLTRDHPEERHRCLKCASEFIFKQELSSHVKQGNCQPATSTSSATSTTAETSIRQCPDCGFSTPFESEHLLHRVLNHSEAIPSGGRYPCPRCDKTFAKTALRNHLRSHTGERAFLCRVCGARFGRRDVLARHKASQHGAGRNSSSSGRGSATKKKTLDNTELEGSRTTEGRSRDFLCSYCSDSFYDKGALEKHLQRHTGKRYPCRTVEGCVFSGRSAAELSAHQRTHSSVREVHCLECLYSAKTKGQLSKHIQRLHSDRVRLQSCPHCDFTTANSTHLKRHVALHSGRKPYLCPYCSFSCTLLENLRKHVISSKLHPGKCLYSCPDCELKTNYSKELVSHLVSCHGYSGPGARELAGRRVHLQDDPASQGSLLQGTSGVTGTLLPVPPNKRKKQRRGGEEGGEEPQEEVVELPSLSLSRGDPSGDGGEEPEDVIFIEVVDQDLEDVLFQGSSSAEPAPFHLESYHPQD